LFVTGAFFEGADILNVEKTLGTYLISNTRFEKNIANGFGGGLVLHSAPARMQDTVFLKNVAQGTYPAGGALVLTGGAVLNALGLASAPVQSWEVSMEINYNLKGVSFQENTASMAGALLLVGENLDLDMVGGDFSSNSATGTNYSEGGGAIVVGTGVTTHLVGTTFSMNTAVTQGGAIWFFGSISSMSLSCTVESPFLQPLTHFGEGGIDGKSKSYFNRIKFEMNSAKQGGAIYSEASAHTVSISGSGFFGNSAEDFGGAIYATNGASISLERSDLNYNQASVSSGGAIAVAGSTTVSISNSRLSNNQAFEDGGTLHVTNGALTDIRNSTISSSVAQGNGGAILVRSAGLTLREASSISKSRSITGGGGGLHASGNVVISMEDISLFECHAGEGGGAMRISTTQTATPSIEVRRSRIEESSTSSTFGGSGIMINSGNLLLQDSSMTTSVRLLADGTDMTITGTKAMATVLGSNISRTSVTGGAEMMVNEDDLFVKHFQYKWPCNGSTEAIHFAGMPDDVYVSQSAFGICLNYDWAISNTPASLSLCDSHSHGLSDANNRFLFESITLGLICGGGDENSALGDRVWLLSADAALDTSNILGTDVEGAKRRPSTANYTSSTCIVYTEPGQDTTLIIFISMVAVLLLVFLVVERLYNHYLYLETEKFDWNVLQEDISLECIVDPDEGMDANVMMANRSRHTQHMVSWFGYGLFHT